MTGCRLPFLVALLLVSLAGPVAAQGLVFPPGDVDGSLSEPDRIETDRDSFTPATRTVGAGRLVVESAYTFQDNRRFDETHSFPELLLRYGICKRIELRLGWNYEVGGEGTSTTGVDAGDESDLFEGPGLIREHQINYGFKVGLTEQAGLLPDSIFILQGSTPTGGPGTATTFVSTYAFGWALSPRARWDTAFRYGYDTEEGDHFNSWAPSTVLKVEIFERWMIHAEYFGIFTTNRAENRQRHFFSPGVHYLLTDNFEVGVRVGWGLNDESARFFCNAGVGLRF